MVYWLLLHTVHVYCILIDLTTHTSLSPIWRGFVPSFVNKMNCELMLTYDNPAFRQTESTNLTGQKTLPMIWGTYIKLVTKYQISAINSC